VRALLVLGAVIAAVDTASAQPRPAASAGSNPTSICRTKEVVNENTYHCIGDVELTMDDTTLFADEAWYFADEKRAVAAGNVLFIQGNNRITADRAEMDTETKLGVFHNAWGLANIQPQRQSVAAAGGFVAPQLAGQDTDVYFFGETVEKIGPKKYKIRNGGFTTCVQPSPRWNLSANEVVLNIDSYTLLKNAVFNVKDVPLFYLPVLYYPTKEEGRATGFLLPTYGRSSLRGQQFSNAFFWAINRSHDATVKHDWYSKGDQGVSGEYRYVTLSGDGTIETLFLNQSENTYGLPSRTYNIRGGANQQLPGNFRARARVDYFSSLATNQTLHSSLYDASNSQRTYGGNVVGLWQGNSINGTFERSERFSSETDSSLLGTAPRISVSRGERPLYRNSTAYFAIGSEYVRYERETRRGEEVADTGVGRFDLNPQIRYPFKRWQWFTVNTTASWRTTFYDRSYFPGGGGLIGDDSLFRQYVAVTANAVGPVFNRVFNTPDSGYAERFKHTIEPFMSVQRTTPIDDYERIIKTDSTDWVVGNSTNYTYGLSNRVYAKRRLGASAATSAQEILSVDLRQSYYTDARSSQNDPQYTNGYNTVPTNFSPLALSVRASPSTSFNTTFRAELDPQYRQFRSTSLDTRYSWTTRFQSGIGWNRRYFIEQVPGFDNPDLLSHYVNLDTRLSTADNRFGGSYSMNFDVAQTSFTQQRINGFYNAQCCGIAMEYQRFNYSSSSGVPADNRFFMSFTLAGLGNFSPFSGALGNVPR
jgi:LPS-assembly protein